MATPNPPPTTTTTDDMDSPWDEIENNYFTSMRAHRDQEDRDLESAFRARTDELRAKILENYSAQTELLRQLEALKREYEARLAELAGLDGELEGVRREREKEREKEDEERRAWFRTFRRGGLAYRGVEEQMGVNGVEEGRRQPDAEMEVVEERRADDGGAVNGRVEGASSPEMQTSDGRMADDGHVVNGQDEGQSSPETETADDRMVDRGEAVNGRKATLPAAEMEAVEDKMADDGEAVNGCDESRAPPVMETAEDKMTDDANAVNGRSEGPATVELEVVEDKEPDNGETVNGQRSEEPPREQLPAVEDAGPDTRELVIAQEDEPQPLPPAGAANLPSGHQYQEEQEQLADIETAHSERLMDEHPQEPAISEKEMPDALPVIQGREEEPPAADVEMSGTSASEEPHEQQETPTVEYDMEDAPTPDHDKEISGAEVIEGPKSPEHVQVPPNEAQPDVEPSRAEGPASSPESPTDQESQGTGVVEAPVPSSEAVEVPVSASKAVEPPVFAPKVEPPDGNQAPDSTPGDDIEMADVQPSTEKKSREIEPPQEPSQTMPTAVASPSSSSELSSRNTTPELDTPVSMPGEPSPPATPGATTLGAVEVLGESGERIGWLQPPDTSNYFLDRLRDRTIKRPVQIRHGRKFTAEDLEAVPRPSDSDARPFKFLSFYVQAIGDIQERPCLDCSMNHGLFQSCVVISDDPELDRCGNCEWNKRRCHGAPPERPSSSRHSNTAKSPTKSPRRPRTASGTFLAVKNTDDLEEQSELAASTGSEWGNSKDTKKGPRKSLPTNRKAPAPATPLATSFKSDTDTEINRQVLCLRDNGVVFTDPPMMRGVPLAKISPDHPYWDPEWKPLEKLVEPIRQKHQERYEELEKAGSTSRDKHLANRDAKRGRLVLKFLEEGELHPYQLVGKEWINYKITNYDTLYRLAQLLTDELPRMNLDIKPSEWLRHRLWELYQEKGARFDVASWISKAYHDRKIEQLREKNGFARVGRPPAHAMKGADPGSSSKKATAPRSLKRKDPHQTPESTPSKTKVGSTSKPPTAAPEAFPPQQKPPKKIKIIATQSQSQESGVEALLSATLEKAKKTKIILNNNNSPFPTPSSTTTADKKHQLFAKEEDDDPLEYDGYTSTDSISDDRLHPNDWRLHQVRTRTFATNPRVTQYWHWVTENKDNNKKSTTTPTKEIEHQVLEWVRPARWAVFKRPYNFHLNLDDVQEVAFARGSTRVVVVHCKGRDGKDTNPRGDVMAQFKRERTKRRFLAFLAGKGVKVVEVGSDVIEMRWNSISPETLPVPDSED